MTTNSLTTETVTGNGAATTFGYDDANNRESMSKGGVNTSYAYNAANQLTEFTEGNRTVTCTYDNNGNRQTRTERVGGFFKKDVKPVTAKKETRKKEGK